MEAIKLLFLVALATCASAAGVGKRQSEPERPPPIDDPCALVLCAAPDCAPGQYYVPEGECCPVCPADCSLVRCALPECENGVIKTPIGECCPVCIEPDCSAVSCLKPVCPEGQRLEVPEGECCPTCVPDCPFKGQEFSSCRGCETTCIDSINEEISICPAICLEGCSCPRGQLLDSLAGRCVSQAECKNPCALIECAPGFVCRVDRDTGKGFCAPTGCKPRFCPTPLCIEGTTPQIPEGGCCPECLPDCSAVSCLKPKCPEGQTPQVPDGECCPVCQQDCSTVFCIAIASCPEGEELVSIPEECCPVCLPDCSAVSCLKPECPLGQTPVVPEGECCPVCPIDCRFVLCDLPECEKGEVLETKPGQCCPGCTKPDCSAVLCLAIAVCPDGQEPVVPPGECCAQCPPPPDCSAVLCLAIDTCPNGEEPVVPPGECCAQCPPPDCSAVLCLAIAVCPDGEEPVVPPGECCAQCPPPPDCSAVLCLAIAVCPDGQEPVVPPGECCAQCPPPDCSAVLCPKIKCPEGQRLVTPEGACCSECIVDCPIDGQEFSFCAGCDTTCINVINEEVLFCPAVCRVGCSCPGGQVIDTIAQECVPRDECTNPCSLIFCPAGSRCKVTDEGEGFCTEPSCELNNGGCRKGEICQLVDGAVQCLGSNEICSLPSETGPCKAAFPRYFHNSQTGQCELFTYGGCQGNNNNFETLLECQEFCDVLTCDINNGGCAKDEICQLQEVLCKKAPCNPVIRCLSRDEVCSLPSDVGPCDGVEKRYFFGTGECVSFTYGGCGGNANNFETLEACEAFCEPGPCARDCPTGSSCQTFEPTGETFCLPSCELDNGGCPNGRTCRLEDVQCVRAPCPPVVTCIDSCATVRCRTGTRCEVDQDSGRAFCMPDCELANGGCPNGKTCHLEEVVCVTTPCPPEVRCLSQSDVCSLPSETGPCEALIPRYFHNSETDLCEKFVYGGCEGNANNFETLEECQDDCGSDVCSLPSDSGLCLAFFRRFFFNSKTGKCERFVYGGCGGNENNFETLEECQDECVPDPCDDMECPTGSACKVFEPTGEAFCEADCGLDNGGCDKGQICQQEVVQCIRAPCPSAVRCLDPSEVCQLPSDSGPCRAFFIRFYHNSESGRCERFVYGGCRGNANNFETLEECEGTCVPPDACDDMDCPTGSACKVFEPTGEAFCEPSCELANGGCGEGQTCSLKQVQCVRAPCPPVAECSCPPTCSKEFCKGNSRALCSNPGPRELPGCTGPCQLSYCKACVFSSDALVVPEGLDQCRVCEDLRDYSRPSTCYWRWSRCTGHRYWSANRPNRGDGEYSNEHIICLRPPCPLRG